MRLPSVDMLGTVRLLRKIPGVLFLLAFLVFLVTSNVRIAFNSVALYELGFSRHDVARTTGLEPAELSKAAEQVRDYFNSSDELLDVRISVDGVTRSIFVEREILHMRDVKDVAWTAFRIQEGSALYLFFFVTVGALTSVVAFSRSPFNSEAEDWRSSGLMESALRTTSSSGGVDTPIFDGGWNWPRGTWPVSAS